MSRSTLRVHSGARYATVRVLAPVILALLCWPVIGEGDILGTKGTDADNTPSQKALRQVIMTDVSRGFAGVVTIGRGNRILLSDGFGAIGGRAVKREDEFWIASTGKQFVSAAILTLVDEGKVRLSDPLSRFFPDCPVEKCGITVLQLLTHESGFQQSYVSEGQSSRKEAVSRMMREPLSAGPENSFRYSNINIQLAAAIVEVVSGDDYKTFVSRRLWRPSGLKRTGFAGSRAAQAVLPTPSVRVNKQLTAEFWGEQGVYSTAPDLYRWTRAIRNGKVLSEASTRELWTPHVKIQEGTGALCWFLGTSSGGKRTIFVRGNEDSGPNSLIYYYPDSDVTIIVLTHAGQAADDISWSRALQKQLEKELGL